MPVNLWELSPAKSPVWSLTSWCLLRGFALTLNPRRKCDSGTCVVSFLPLDFDLVDCRNLDPTLSLTKYTFAGAFLDDKKFVAQFLVDLFNSPSLRASMPVATKQSGQTSLAGVVESVQYEVLSTSVTSMTFFDRLVEEGTSRGGFQTLAPFATALLCRDSHRDRLHSQVH